MDGVQYAKKWLREKQLQNPVSARSRITTRHRLMQFVRYVEDAGVSFDQVDAQVLWEYQGEFLERINPQTGRPVKKSTVESGLSSIRSFGDFLVQEGVWFTNPAKAVDIVRGVKNPPIDMIKEEMMGRFMEELGQWWRDPDIRQQRAHLRYYVMAELQYASGLRLNELGNLTKEDIDLERLLITVREGKGGKDRVAYLNHWTADLLREYLKVRHLLFMGGEGKNPTLFGAKMDNLCRAYNKHLNKVARGLGIDRWYNHKFRHALGYHLLRSGCPLRQIQGILGHEKIQSTEVYTKVDSEDVREVLDECHPRG
jgi:site-specific recombinase XerD